MFKINIMKIYIVALILSSASFSAQISPRKPLIIDSTKLPKIEKSIIKTPSDVSKFDTAIAKLYKMPVAKPKNLELYSSLKAPKKDSTLHKIPNILDAAKRHKLALK